MIEPRINTIMLFVQYQRRWFNAHACATVSSVDFGETVRRRRASLGLTLEKLAERARLSTNYLGSIELGKRDPSLSTVLAIAKALRIPPGELLGGVKNLTSEGFEAGRIFDALPADVQAPLLPFLRSLARRR